MSRGATSALCKSKDSATAVQHILTTLHRWGIHTLADFTRLEREQIRTRLGSEAVRLWDRASGRSTRLLKFVEPPECFVESFEFEYEIETIEPLLFILRRFLEQLAIRLTGIYLVARDLTLRIQFSNNQTYERRFEIPQPTTDVDLLFRMLHTHLEGFQSDHPIAAVSLEASPIKPAPQQFGLFETSLRNPNQLRETLARLTALLGQEHVGRPVLEDSFRPDAFRLERFSWELPVNPNGGEMKEGPALRRLRPSPRVAVALEGDVPAYVQSEPISGGATGQSGPYLASGNWWDEKTWARKEWDLNLNTGAVCRLHYDGEHWGLDGIYD